jgi:hypothetical protein
VHFHVAGEIICTTAEHLFFLHPTKRLSTGKSRAENGVCIRYGLAAWRAGFGITTLGLGAYGLLSSKACFAAGTPLLTPHGAKSVEAFQVGDLLLSRPDDNPKGDVEAKCVEEVFVRSALIWHVHVGAQVIRSTAEHPFYVEDEGWVACQDLKIGDRLLAADGTTVTVDDLLDTGEYETVYNLRIQDYHTYFVGCDEWGFSVWAHNADCAAAAKGSLEEIIARNGGTKDAGHANPNAYQFPSKSAAKQAASEISGNLGANPTKIPLSAYSEPTLPWSSASGKNTIGKHSQALDSFGKPVAGYHDHFAGHSAFGETQGHFNAWGRFGDYKNTIHLFYPG